jgi:hypothetical protein
MPPVKRFEPVLQYRYSIVGTRYITDPVTNYCKSVTLPTVNNNEFKFKYSNGFLNAKGITEWDDVTIELYNDSANGSISQIYSWLSVHRDIDTHMELFKDDYSEILTIEVLNPKQETIQKWKLYNAYILNAEFGNMDWSSSDPNIITLTIRYDWATLE